LVALTGIPITPVLASPYSGDCMRPLVRAKFRQLAFSIRIRTISANVGTGAVGMRASSGVKSDREIILVLKDRYRAGAMNGVQQAAHVL
jgi:hypothetical protein